MRLDEVISLIKKKGFLDTFKVLTGNRNHIMEKREFYRHLNEFSNYHSFFKVRELLLEKNLIEIEENHDKKYVKLTEKGLKVYNKLIEIYEIIKNSHI